MRLSRKFLGQRRSHHRTHNDDKLGVIQYVTTSVDITTEGKIVGIKNEITLQISSKKDSKLDRILSSLTEEDRTELIEVLSDPEISSAVIAKVLEKRNFDIGERTIQRSRDKYLDN